MDPLEERYFCGVDIGASAAKLVLLDPQGTVVGSAIHKSGVNFAEAAEKCLRDALRQAGAGKRPAIAAVATGYGRRNVPFADDRMTEITCHARGCHHLFRRAITIVDIGGQDSKIIKLYADGTRRDFKMNRKCAAGTGAFLEELAAQMDLPLEKLDAIAAGATGEPLPIGSYCTVFAKTEILAKIREGRPVEEIVLGVFDSVVKRALEMDPLSDPDVVLTGGVVAHNPVIVRLFEQRLHKKLLVPEQPQLTGALGAALFAAEMQH